MVNYKIIGNRIQEKRREKGITQYQMAKKLNVSPGYISQIERGYTKINLDILSSISEHLDCDMAEFVYKSNEHTINFYDDDIAKDYKKLSLHERKILSHILKSYIENR